jgi:serine protease
MPFCDSFDSKHPTARKINGITRPALMAGLLSLLTVTAPAAPIKVPGDQPTIQQAIDAAVNSDVVFVSPGTYFERIDYRGKAISIQSTNGPAQTVIDGSLGGSVVKFQNHEGPQSVLTGFTIQRGNETFGAGLYLLGASPTITQNVFRDNIQQSGGFGAAIAGNGSSAVVERNLFVSNSCDTQFHSGVVSFVNGSSPRIIDNIFSTNPCCAINIGLPAGNNPVVANNTIVQNRVGIRVDGRFSTTHLYANNILVGNSIGLQVDFLISGHEPAWTNNLIYLNTTNYIGIADQTGLSGNISKDPLFLLDRDDFRLLPESPAIDVGTLSVPNLPPIDFAGKPRVVDGNWDGSALPDLGAFECTPRHLAMPLRPNLAASSTK